MHNAFDSVASVLTEDNVATYGRTMMLSVCGLMWMTAMERRPKDSTHAIKSHLPQGFDRSLLASKLQARMTKQRVNELLRIDELRNAMRSTTNRQERVSMVRDLRHRVLTGLVAGAYLHALTIGLFCVKNTIRVMYFVHHQRREKAQRGGPGSGNMLSTWWRVGFKGMLVQRLLGGDSGSPFANDRLDESGPGTPAPGAMMPLPLLPDSPSAFLSPVTGTGSSTLAKSLPFTSPAVSSPGLYSYLSAAASPTEFLSSLENAFSVKACLEIATPRVLKEANAVVEEVLADERINALMAPTVAITRDDLAAVFQRLADAMNQRMCVSECLRFDPPPPRRASSTPFPEVDGQDPGSEIGSASQARVSLDQEEDEESETVRFQQLPALQQTAAGRSPGALGDLTTTSNNTSHATNLPSIFTSPEALFGPGGPSSLENDAGMFGTPLDLPSSPTQQESAMQLQQYAESFQDVIHSVSFGELVLVDSSRVLRSVFQHATSLEELKNYDANKKSAPVIMVLTRLEELRQRLADGEFSIPPYMELFCSELVRCSSR